VTSRLIAPKRVSAKVEKQRDMLFATESDDEDDEESVQPAAKRVHLGSSLADILPAPKHKQSQAAAVKLPPPVKPVQMAAPVFDDEIEAEILNQRLPTAEELAERNEAAYTAPVMQDGFGDALRGAYSAQADDVPEDLRQHLRTGGRVLEVNQADLVRKKDAGSSQPIGIGVRVRGFVGSANFAV